MRLQIFLADAAQADQHGKVSALGLGWRNCGSPVPAFAVVLLLEVDWDETNTQHKLVVELLTEDGRPVIVAAQLGQQLIRFEAMAEAGRPPGATHGDPQRVPVVFAFPPGLPLQPGRYQWRASVENFPNATVNESLIVGPPVAIVVQQPPPPS